MAEIGQKDHRKRLREQYLADPNAEMTDRQLLEMFLTYAIPRKDVKPYVYELLNEYKTLDNIFSADIDELSRVKGLGEASAIMVHLVSKIHKRIEQEQQAEKVKLNTSAKAVKYVADRIGNSKKEQFLVITLDNANQVINCHNVSDGDQVHVDFDKQKMFRKVLNDDAFGVILAHNHPNAKAEASKADVNVTVEVLNIFRKLGIKLKDHIIVNETDSYCMSGDIDHANYFD